MRAVSLEFETSQESPRAADEAAAAAAATAATGTGTALAEQRRGVVVAWREAPMLVRVMFALDLLMGALYVISRRAKDVLAKPVLDFVDLNAEGNLPSWFSAAQLGLIGGLLVAFAVTKLRRGTRAVWAAWAVMLTGGLFLFMSLDEMTTLHENFGYWLDKLLHRRDTIFVVTGFWMLICAPLFLAALALLAFWARSYLRGPARKKMAMKFAAGVAVYIVAAAGVEALSNFATPHGTAARALVLTEELGEMVGATMILWSVIELMSTHGVRLLVSDDKSTSQ